MKPLALLLLASCVAHVEPAPTERGKCDPPTFTEPGCIIPGCDSRGCIVQCPEPDGSYWDKQPDGTLVHWAWCPLAPGTNLTATICTVEAK